MNTKTAQDFLFTNVLSSIVPSALIIAAGETKGKPKGELVSILVLGDKLIRRKKERVTIHMSQMVVDKGVFEEYGL